MNQKVYYLLLLFLIFYVFTCKDNPTDSENTVDNNLETGTVTDIDSNVYKTVKIGNQWWMTENLKVTHYQNGNPIPKVTDPNIWRALITAAYCYYNNDTTNIADYGMLYNQFAIRDSCNIAPLGWHVPSEEEWRVLLDTLGGSLVAGSKMKETGTTHWPEPNRDATNSSGFSALPGGWRSNDSGICYHMGIYGRWWTSTEFRTPSFIVGTGSSVVTFQEYTWLRKGLSVRCVKD